MRHLINQQLLVTGHPCVCGEQRGNRSTGSRPGGSSLRVRGTAIVVTDHNIQHGSSLRVRGTGNIQPDTRLQLRVIPACARNSG